MVPGSRRNRSQQSLGLGTLEKGSGWFRVQGKKWEGPASSGTTLSQARQVLPGPGVLLGFLSGIWNALFHHQPSLSPTQVVTRTLLSVSSSCPSFKPKGPEINPGLFSPVSSPWPCSPLAWLPGAVPSPYPSILVSAPISQPTGFVCDMASVPDRIRFESSFGWMLYVSTPLDPSAVSVLSPWCRRNQPGLDEQSQWGHRCSGVPRSLAFTVHRDKSEPEPARDTEGGE